MSNKTSDKNVANIERLNNFIEAYKQTKEQSFIVDTINKDFFFEFVDCLLAEREQMLKEKQDYKQDIKDFQNALNEENLRCANYAIENNELKKRIQELEEKNKHLSNVSDYETISLECVHLEEQLEIANSRIQELEEENKKLKAQHIFTRNKATNEEKAELYDVIDKTIDTFLEQEKPIWQQEMIKDKMSLEEALSIVNEMYQNKYKIIEKNNTIYVDKLNDIKFTSLEFASVRLLREVQSLQYKLENSIPEQVVKEVLQNNRNKLFGMTYLSKEQYRTYEMQIERINKIEQELLEGEK